MKPHIVVHSLPPFGMREIITNIKVRKLMGWDKERLTVKAKVARASKAKQEIHYLHLMGRQVFSNPKKMAFLLAPAFTVQRDVMWYRISLWPVGVSCPCCVPSQLLVKPQPYPLAGQREKQRRPWRCVSIAQQQQKYPCVINTVFVTSPKHNTIPAAMKKMNSVPAKTSTIYAT